MAFQKGQSGNPAGRPRGSVNYSALRKTIRTKEVLAVVEDAALAGDMTAARLLLERALPPLRPVDVPVVFPVADSLADVGRTVMQAVAQGRLTPSEGTTLMSGLAQLGKVIESDELAKRIEQLERGHNTPQETPAP